MCLFVLLAGPTRSLSSRGLNRSVKQKRWIFVKTVCFQAGNRVGVKRCSDDTMHIFVDGEDMGPAATAVAKVQAALLVCSAKLTRGCHSSSLLLLPECVRGFGLVRADNSRVHCELDSDRGHGKCQGSVALLRKLQRGRGGLHPCQRGGNCKCVLSPPVKDAVFKF